MIHNHDEIARMRKELIDKLKKEELSHGSYSLWYDELANFRKEITSKFKKKWTFGLNYVTETKIKTGDKLDHHLLGYLAPLDFTRIGFNNIRMNPSQQLIDLNNQFKQRGIRFIYVPLPCKLAVYPEKIIGKASIPLDGKVIPQWRKMISECLNNSDMEIIDIYDLLLEKKYLNDLYQKGHQISPFCAGLIGKEIASYIRETTNFAPDEIQLKEVIQRIEKIALPGNKTSKYDFQYDLYDASINLIKDNDGIMSPYINCKDDSSIGIFGDCNLQAYEQYGAGIRANLAFCLNYPIAYLGRHLPFSNQLGETIDSFAEHSLKNIKIAIYVGFPSGSFVRVPHNEKIYRFHPITILLSLLNDKQFPSRMSWSTKGIEDKHF